MNKRKILILASFLLVFTFMVTMSAVVGAADKSITSSGTSVDIVLDESGNAHVTET